jgi:hypothetical protein
VNGRLVEVGSLVIDGVWGGVRIKRSTGYKDRTRFNSLVDCLNHLEMMDNEPALVWAATGRNSLKELLNWFQNKDKKSPPWDKSGDILTTRMYEWLENNTKLSKNTKRTYKGSLDVLFKHTGKYPDKITSLPSILEVMKKEYVNFQVAFNNTYSVCLSFLNAEVGTSHNIYKKVQSIGKYAKSTIKAKRNPSPLEPLEIQNRFIKDPSNSFQKIVFFLCCTGMRPYEYIEHGFKVEDNHIEIFGKKTKHSHRIVPKVFSGLDPQPSSLGYSIDTLRDEFKRWFPERTIQDTRYTFINWIQKAGVETNRMNYYQGHQQSQTGEYLRRDVVKYWVEEDSRRIIEFLKMSLNQFPSIETKSLTLPKSVEELTASVAYSSKKDIVEHLNKYLRDNYPSIFRVLYEVDGLTRIPTIDP